MMKHKRIAVTGLGVVSSLGNEPDLFFENLLAGKSGVKPITLFPCEEYPTRFAGFIPPFDAGDLIDKKQARRIDRSIAFAIYSGKKALIQAKLGSEEERSILNLNRCGIIIGSGMGGMETFSDGVQALLEKGHRRVSPFFVPYIITNMGGALLAIDVGFKGPNYSISTACATGSHSIIAAANHIRNGEADLMICGGTEAAVAPIGLAGFCACKALSQRNDAPEEASRPWDKDRDGFVMGEGAGVLILEEFEHAKKRGAPIIAEYLGGSINCDAYHMTDPLPSGEGVANCVRMALLDAGILPEEIEYINAHATSTIMGDMAEINALQQIFQNRSKIAINATKSLIGHALGAAGGLEAVVSILSLVHQKIHGNPNLKNPEEGLDFYAPLASTSWKCNKALSNSFGFGGHNASLVFGIAL